MDQSTFSSHQSAKSGTLQMDIAALALCLGITAVGYLAVIQPILDVRATRRSERSELAAKQEQLTRHTITVSSLSKDLANLKKAAGELPAIQALPLQQSNQRLADLTHLAAQANLNVDELRTAAVVQCDRFQVVPIHLSGTGAFQKCSSFLHQVRQAFPDTAVSALTIARQPGMPAEDATFRIQLSWYAAAPGRAGLAVAQP